MRTMRGVFAQLVWMAVIWPSATEAALSAVRRRGGVAVRALVCWTLLVVATPGCAVVLAAKQPDAKDLSVLTPGTPRSMVVGELDPPVWSGERAGAKVEVFAFVDGYSKATKAARAFFHAAADVFTLGLWEVVGTPTEAIFTGSKMKVEVVYDTHDQVVSVRNLEPVKDAPPPPAEGRDAQLDGTAAR